MYINNNLYNKGELYLKYKDTIQCCLYDVASETQIKQFHWRTTKKKNKFYVCTGQSKKGNKILYLHNLLMDFQPNGVFVVDHINGNSLDNRKENLRIIPVLHNKQNNTVRKDNKSTGLRGISFDKSIKKYSVDFHNKGKRFYFKPFKTLTEAAYIRYLCETTYLKDLTKETTQVKLLTHTQKLPLQKKQELQNYFKERI
jgi:hypothetical protein